MALQRKLIVSNEEINNVLRPLVLKHLSVRGANNCKRKVRIAGHNINLTSDRYKVFMTKGTRCVECGIEGTIWALERHTPGKGCVPNARYHLNLYAVTEQGEVMMTKDHIIPKSQGGPDRLDNYQPMCSICNHRKDNIPASNKYKGHYYNQSKSKSSGKKIWLLVVKTHESVSLRSFSAYHEAVICAEEMMRNTGQQFIEEIKGTRWKTSDAKLYIDPLVIDGGNINFYFSEKENKTELITTNFHANETYIV